MKLISRSFLTIATAVMMAAPVHAHPGHEDGHELTWDLGHLAAHPLATLTCGAVLAAAAWGLTVWAKRAARTRAQSLRGSQPS